MAERTSHRLYFVGLQLLLLTYTAQSFVLLTANMEDIKKVARKFVSDDLADKIAAFIGSATSQITNQAPNVSEENELQSQDMSSDNDSNKLRGIARQKEDKNSRSPKESFIKEYKTKNVRNEPGSVEAKPKNRETNSHEAFIKKLNRLEDAKLQIWHKEKNEAYSDRASEEEHPKDTSKYSKPENRQQYHPDKPPPPKYQEPNKMKIKKHKQNKKDAIKPFVSAYRSPNIDLKLHEEDQSVSEERRQSTPNHLKTKNYEHKTAELSSDESTKSEYIKHGTQPETATTRFSGLRAEVLSELTTGKEITDFDQYDNPKYPKAELVATSGPVMLPKIPSYNIE